MRINVVVRGEVYADIEVDRKPDWDGRLKLTPSELQEACRALKDRHSNEVYAEPGEIEVTEWDLLDPPDPPPSFDIPGQALLFDGAHHV